MLDPVERLGEKSVTKILQDTELNMLKKVKNIFDKNGLSFFLACGTALGCARHGGFIPWDDDIDIYIRGKDYDRVKEIFKTQDTGNLQFQDYSTVAGYPYTFPKIVDTSTSLVEKSFSHLNYKCGVYIDVFPIYGITNNKQLRRMSEIIRYTRYGLIKAYFFDYESGINKMLHILAKTFVNPTKIQEKLTKMYKNDLDNIDVLIEPGIYGRKALLKASSFSGICMMKFENAEMPMPTGYQDYLADYYGDYMKLPSEDERVARHQIAVLEVPGIQELQN